MREDVSRTHRNIQKCLELDVGVRDGFTTQTSHGELPG